MASNLTATIVSPLIMGRISFAMLIFSVKYRRLAQRNLTTGGLFYKVSAGSYTISLIHLGNSGER